MVKKLEHQEISVDDLRSELEERLDRDAVAALCVEVGIPAGQMEGKDKGALIELFMGQGSLEELLASLMAGDAAGGESREAPGTGGPGESSVDGLEVSAEDLRAELTSFWDVGILREIAAGFGVTLDEGADLPAVVDGLLTGVEPKALVAELVQREAQREAASTATLEPTSAPGPVAAITTAEVGTHAGDGAPAAASPKVEELPERATPELAALTATPAEPVKAPEEPVKTPAEPGPPAEGDDMEILRQMRALRSTMVTPPVEGAALRDATTEPGTPEGDEEERSVSLGALLATGILAALVVFVFKPLVWHDGKLTWPPSAATPSPSLRPTLPPSLLPTPPSTSSSGLVAATTGTVVVTTTVVALPPTLVTPTASVTATKSPSLVPSPPPTASVAATKSPSLLSSPSPTPTPTPTPTPGPSPLPSLLPTLAPLDVAVPEFPADPLEDLYPRLARVLAHPDTPLSLDDVALRLGGEHGAPAVQAAIDEPVTEGAAWHKGVRLLALGEIRKSEEALRGALWSTPRGRERATVLLLLAKVRGLMGNLTYAMTTYRKALAEDKTDELAALGICRTYEKTGQSRTARRFAEEFMTLNTAPALAEWATATQSPSLAATQSPSLLPSPSPSPSPSPLPTPTPVPTPTPTPTPVPTDVAVEPPHRPAAELLERAEALESSRGVGPDVVTLYEEVLASLEPLEAGKLARVQRKVADWCADHGESERALSLYLECDPPEAVTPDRASALARIASEAGDEDARRRYQARAQTAPARDLIELFRSAQTYEREHRYQEAAALYRQVIDTADAPNLVKADAHFNLAFCLRVLRRYDEAIAEADKAEKLGKKVDPGFKILLNLRR